MSQRDNHDDGAAGDLSATGHLTLEQLDELTGGVDAASASSRHLSECVSCRVALAAQVEVRQWLQGSVAEPMPAELVRRIDDALSRAALDPHAHNHATVLPMTSGSGRAGRLHRVTQSGAAKALVAAAFVAVIALGGYTALHRAPSSNSASSGAAASGADSEKGAASAAAAAAAVRQSGTAYTRADIAAQVDRLLAQSPGSSGGSDSSASSGGAQPLAAGDATTLTSASGLQACLSALGAAATQPLLVDLGTYAGKPVAVLVLPTTGGGREVWVVSRTCAAGHDGMQLYLRLS